jgi:hypothetical protein
MHAKAMPSVWASVEVLLTLFVILAASAGTFWVLVRRWESHRQWLALSEWGRAHGLRQRALDASRLPPPLDALSPRQPVVRLCMGNGSTLLIQFQTSPLDPQPGGGAPVASGPAIWNVLLRPLEAKWRATGLRPTGAAASLLDLYSLSGFPQLGATDRFTVFAADSADARALSDTMTRSLLPPDVGLLLAGNHLLLDFSDRPFDEIELDRMLALANQVAEKLPAPDSTRRGMH